MKMNAKNKTSYPHGQLACQQMKNLLLQWEMISVFGRKCISSKQFRELRTMQPSCRQADYTGALWLSVPLKPP